MLNYVNYWSNMKYQEKFYPESAITGYTFIDGTIAFYNSVHALVDEKGAADVTLLDLGCGRGFFAHELHSKADHYRLGLRNFKGKVKKVIGMDVNPIAETNPTIDEFVFIEPDQKWNLPGECVDVILCDFVVEHVNDVDLFFSEVHRILKPGGWICIRTTNKNGYVGITARVIPNFMHAKVLGKVQDERKEEDVFPTTFKCNTPKKLDRKLKAFGMHSYVIPYEGEPMYLSFSKLAYRLGVIFQKLAPRGLKNTLFAFGQKK